MSDYDEYDNDSNTPKALRDHAKSLEKKLEDALKAIEAANQRAEKAEKAVKSSSLKDLLTAAGIDPKFAARADRDGAEATEDGVKAWIEENKDFYNFAPKAKEEAAVSDEDELEDDEDEGIDPDLADALSQSAALDAQGTSRPAREINQAIAKLPDNLSPEEGVAQLRALGLLG